MKSYSNNKIKNILGIIAVIFLFAMAMNGCKDQSTSDQKIQGSTDAGKETKNAANGETGKIGVKCSINADCGAPIIGEPYCFQGSVTVDIKMPKCNLPGTINSYCTMESRTNVTDCKRDTEICRKGKCLVIAELPCNDTDGGLNYNVSGRVFDALLEESIDKCESENKLLERYCEYGNKGRGMTKEYMCPSNMKCSMGSCVPERD
ncbi:MAG: hypothetical protein N3D84_01610 [Candidatus Woesearchaeota archaeon]|nr:hypothetical protein [Candidatus Woesearchaeota archaeon]